MRRLEWIILSVLLSWSVLALLPASIWYKAGSIRVDDFMEGEQMTLHYDGEVRRDFIGSYSVRIFNVDKAETVGDDSSGEFQYKTKSQRPNSITIEWWSPRNADFHNLKAGSYTMETCWFVSAFWIVPRKRTCAESNIFTVLPSGAPPVSGIAETVQELQQKIVGRTPEGWHRADMAEWVQSCLIDEAECDPYQLPSYLERVE